MLFRLLLQYSFWDSRGSRGRLFYFVGCLAIGVAAVVAVSSLSTGFDAGIRRQAKQLLAADVVVSGRRPLPQELDDLLADTPGSVRADILELVTLVAAQSSSGRGHGLLVELKSVQGPYPLYGAVELEPRRPLAELLGPDRTVVAPEVLTRLGIQVGDTLHIGGSPFTVAGVVRSEPDRVTTALSLGPRVLLSREALDRSKLVTTGSRVSYRALIGLPQAVGPEGLSTTVQRLKDGLPGAEYLRIESYTDAQPRLRRGFSRLAGYLGLTALLSLLVGGVGAAQAVRSWIESRLDAIAVLKCLGMRPREVLSIFVFQAAALGLVGSAVGATLGIFVQLALRQGLGGLLPPGLVEPWQPSAILRGLALGVGVAVVFSLPALLSVLRVPPALVLRRDAQPLPGSRWLPPALGLGLLLVVAAMAVWQAGSLQLAAQFTAGVVATAALLGGAALLVTAAAAKVPREAGRFWLRYGLAALARPGAATTSAIVALGLGLLVILSLHLVQGQVNEALTGELPELAPSAFLIDIQPDQWQGIEELLSRSGAANIDSVPVVMARLTAVDGTPVSELVQNSQDRGQRWALTREQRLTYADKLPPDNELLQGSLWSDPSRTEVSLEAEFAEELRATVGSRLDFDIQGVGLELTVTSLRKVDWESFGINFYVVVEPGVLEAAPQSRIAAARVPEAREQELMDALAQRFPNVTLLPIRDVLEKVVGLLTQLAWGVRFLGGFTVVAALAILAGAVATGSLRRGREVALLKTLGLTRAGVLGAFATEYALVGLVAGALGSAGGAVLAWLVLTQGMEIDWKSDPGGFAWSVALGVALSVAAGLAASLGPLRRRPIETLRQE